MSSTLLHQITKSRPKGRIVIISSPSGGGKTSICRALLTPAHRRQGWTFSVSYTTRSRRRGERNGREYHFVTEAEFKKLVRANFFAEHFKVHQYHYGTPRAPLEKVRRHGGVMLLDVDVQGARRLRREYPEAAAIFVLPPSVSELRRRLKKRGTETNEQLRVRFATAREEMRNFRRYGFEYVVVNDRLSEAVRQVEAVITAHTCRVDKLNWEPV
ncbi:MAG: guanylate kinase [Candidatus Zixiibacteriota bacterium]|nr:MAG: guanylate kinase [candidate division Zixibacteria bacterium]